MENIKCPNCGTDIPIESALFSKAEERAKAVYEQKLKQQADRFQSLQRKLDLDREALEAQKTAQEEELKKQVAQRLRAEQAKLSESLEKAAHEKFEGQIKQLQEDNEKRKAENRELRQKELTLLQREAELNEKAEGMELSLKKALLEKQEEIKQQAVLQEREKSELAIREYEKKLNDQKQLIEEMKRKAEQGSMQMQGEVQEMALEELLKGQFPFDDIQPVQKGISGADVMQYIKNEFQQDSGLIIYESKRTKAFSEGWIDKLKDDARRTNASLSVIVTEALPKGMTRFGSMKGVWVCTFSEVQSVAYVLREMLLKEHRALQSVQNMSGKKEMLYQYLTSDSFRQTVIGIVEGFRSIKEQIDHEKRAMQRIWKERERLIDSVISHTTDMYGSVRGIAGSAIGTVQALELPGYENGIDEETGT